MFRYRILVMSLLALLPGAALPAEGHLQMAVAPGRKIVTVSRPTHVTHAGDGSGRLFVTEQEGRNLIVRDGVMLPEPFLDTRGRVSCCGERGLLSVAFPPAYREREHFYVNYTDRSGEKWILHSAPIVFSPPMFTLPVTVWWVRSWFPPMVSWVF